jgi:hypothetical protein
MHFQEKTLSGMGKIWYSENRVQAGGNILKKEEMTLMDLLAEAVGIVAGVIYLGMQIYYGIYYGVAVSHISMNVVMLLLVYVGLTMLSCYPEKVNNLDREACTGDIRRYTVRMLRTVKLIFILSLLFTSVCDVMGYEITSWCSVLVVILILATVFYFEGRIIRMLRNNKKSG